MRLHESATDRTIEERHERPPVRLDVEEHHRLDPAFGVQTELAPGDRLEHLVEGAVAARQRAEAVREVVHPALALVHVVHDVELGQALVRDLTVAKGRRDDTDDLAPGRQRLVGDDTHQADTGTPVDESDPRLAEMPPDRPRRLLVCRGRAESRSTEDTDARDAGRHRRTVVDGSCVPARIGPVIRPTEDPSVTVEAMPDLIALDLPPGPAFVDALQRAWDDGDAILPIDQRLPVSAKADLVAAAGASQVIDGHGRSNRADGWPTEAGDAVVVATSGTTGLPKFAVLDHDAVAASAQITSAAIAADPATDGWLCCLPVAHIGGLSVITRALHTGTPLTVLDRFDPDQAVRAARSGATLVSLVVAALDRIDPAAFRVILLGGSAIPTDRPANSVATYGMTETGSGVVYDGRALDGVELRIDDGEILVRSPTLLRCYRDGTDPKDPDGWYRTGDAGALDGAATLSVTGRIGDVIVTGGEKVWPVTVERAIDETGALDLPSAVVGRPDPEWGHVVTLVCETEGDPPDLDAVRDHLRGILPGYALPRRVETVSALPRTAIGKVQRSLL